MQASEEKDDSPLLDADISRLIKLSREVGYKKQDDVPSRNLVDFKPLSIDKIVAEIGSKPSKSDVSNKAEDGEKTSESNLKAKDNNSQDQKEEPKTGIGLNDNEIEEKQKQDIAESVEENSSDKIIEPPEEEKTQNFEANEILKQNDIPPSNNDEAIEAARKEGIEIGRKVAFSEMEKDQKKNVEELNALIKNIKSKESIDKSELMNSIINVIITLASERAGVEIDKAPEIFKEKIVAFVNEIEHASKKVIVNLNPRDAELIKEISKESFVENIELKENSDLFRGDFTLQMGTIEMGNLISKQLFISDPEIEDSANPPFERADDDLKEETKDLNDLAETSLDQAEDQTKA